MSWEDLGYLAVLIPVVAGAIIFWEMRKPDWGVVNDPPPPVVLEWKAFASKALKAFNEMNATMKEVARVLALTAPEIKKALLELERLEEEDGHEHPGG